MQGMQQQASQPEWINKTEAAERLKMSTRAVLDIASKGKIISKRERDPKTRQLAVVLNAADVERYAYEREHPEEQEIRTQSLVMGQLHREAQGVMSSSMHVLAAIRASDARGKLGPDHETEHYRIKEWTKPGPDSQFHKFKVDGPGNHDYLYIALEESCGPQLILGLEKAYQAGLIASEERKQQWVTVDQAASITGLPASTIKALIEVDAVLKAIDCGPRPGGRYRIKRSELDEINGQVAV